MWYIKTFCTSMFFILFLQLKGLNCSKSWAEGVKNQAKRHVPPFSQMPDGFFGIKFGQQLSHFSDVLRENSYGRYENADASYQEEYTGWPENSEYTTIKGKHFNIERLKYENYGLYCQVKKIKQLMDEELYEIATKSWCNTTNIKIVEEELSQLRGGHDFEKLKKQDIFLYDQLKKIEELLEKEIRNEYIKCKYYGLKPTDCSFNKLPHFDMKQKFKDEIWQDKYKTTKNDDAIKIQGTVNSKSYIKILPNPAIDQRILKEIFETKSAEPLTNTVDSFNILPHFIKKERFNNAFTKSKGLSLTQNITVNQNLNNRFNVLPHFNQIKSFKFKSSSHSQNESCQSKEDKNVDFTPPFKEAQVFKQIDTFKPNSSSENLNSKDESFNVLPHFISKQKFKTGQDLNVNNQNDNIKLTPPFKPAVIFKSVVSDLNLDHDAGRIAQNDTDNQNLNNRFNVLPLFEQTETFRDIKYDQNIDLKDSNDQIKNHTIESKASSQSFNVLPHFESKQTFKSQADNQDQNLSKNKSNQNLNDHFKSLDSEKDNNLKVSHTEAVQNITASQDLDNKFNVLPHFEQTETFKPKIIDLKVSINQTKNNTVENKPSDNKFNVLPHFKLKQTFKSVDFNQSSNLNEQKVTITQNNTIYQNLNDKFNVLPHFKHNSTFKSIIPSKSDILNSTNIPSNQIKTFVIQNNDTDYKFNVLPHFKAQQTFKSGADNKNLNLDNHELSLTENKSEVVQNLNKNVKVVTRLNRIDTFKPNQYLNVNNDSLTQTNNVSVDKELNSNFNILPHFYQIKSFNENSNLNLKNLSLTKNNTSKNVLSEIKNFNLEFNVLPNFDTAKTFNKNASPTQDPLNVVRVNSVRGDIPLSFYKQFKAQTATLKTKKKTISLNLTIVSSPVETLSYSLGRKRLNNLNVSKSNESLNKSQTQEIKNFNLEFKGLPNFNAAKTFNKNASPTQDPLNVIKVNYVRGDIPLTLYKQFKAQNTTLKPNKKEDNFPKSDDSLKPNRDSVIQSWTQEVKNHELLSNNLNISKTIESLNKSQTHENIGNIQKVSQDGDDQSKFAQSWVRDFFKKYELKNEEKNIENRRKVLVKVLKRPFNETKTQGEPKIHNIFKTVGDVIIKEYNGTVPL